jgi:hypothetical protein
VNFGPTLLLPDDLSLKTKSPAARDKLPPFWCCLGFLFSLVTVARGNNPENYGRGGSFFRVSEQISV